MTARSKPWPNLKRTPFALFVDRTNLHVTREAPDTKRKGLGEVLELAGEVGEVVEIYQKAIRKDIPIDPVRVIDELGDVHWAVQAICNRFGWTLDQLQEYTTRKLMARFDLEAEPPEMPPEPETV